MIIHLLVNIHWWYGTLSKKSLPRIKIIFSLTQDAAAVPTGFGIFRHNQQIPRPEIQEVVLEVAMKRNASFISISILCIIMYIPWEPITFIFRITTITHSLKGLKPSCFMVWGSKGCLFVEEFCSPLNFWGLIWGNSFFQDTLNQKLQGVEISWCHLSFTEYLPTKLGNYSIYIYFLKNKRHMYTICAPYTLCLSLYKYIDKDSTI